jgi:hypothetical protein
MSVPDTVIFLMLRDGIDNLLFADRFYKRGDRWNPSFDKDLTDYNKWLEKCDQSLKETTKAANWFADVVRRDVNPMFFAVNGKFMAVEGPSDCLNLPTKVLEYNEEEKKILPDSLFTQNGHEVRRLKDENS